MKYIFILILLFSSILTVSGQVTTDSLNIKYIDGEKVYVRVDSLAKYPINPSIKYSFGFAHSVNETHMQLFIRDNLKYPPEAQKNGIQGHVVIRLIVSKTGKISNYEIYHSADPIIDREALRIVKEMPRKGWTPAILQEKPVNSYFTISITFRLRDNFHRKNS